MKTYARFATVPIGAGLAVLNDGLTVTTTTGSANQARAARSDIAQTEGSRGVEVVFWGDDDVHGALGVVDAAAALTDYVGSAAAAIGWILNLGEVRVGGATLASGIAIPAKGDCIGMLVDFDAGTVSFYLGDAIVYSGALPAAAGPWHFAVSMGSDTAGELACAVNAGQWIPASAAAAAGWAADEAAAIALQLADIDWLTATDDVPANTRYEGVLDASGFETYQAMHHWAWGGDAPTQGGNAQCTVLDPDGLLDAAVAAGVRGSAVQVRQLEVPARAGELLLGPELITDLNALCTASGVTKTANADGSLTLIAVDGASDRGEWRFANFGNSAAGDVFRIVLVARRGAQGTKQFVQSPTALTGIAATAITEADARTYVFTATATGASAIFRVYAAGTGGAAGDQVVVQSLSIRKVLQKRKLTDAVAVARYTADSIEVVDDVRKVLHLRGAHEVLDKRLSRAQFLPSVPTLAGRPIPTSIGAVASMLALPATADGSVSFLCDAPLASVTAALDRGDPLTAVDDWALDPSQQQLLLANAPLGPVVVDGSTIAPDTGATLAQALTDLFARAGLEAWQQADADAIDTATGDAGIGYYDAAGGSCRDALARILPSFGAWWYADVDGALRIVRLVDPDGTADEDLAFDLVGSDPIDDVVIIPDLAPNLTRRFGYRPNAFIHSAGDLVTDLEDVPPARRIELTSACRGEVYGRAPLPARYAHADSNPAFVSVFWNAADAQAELDRTLALYAVERNFYPWRMVDPDFAGKPGQVGRITYPLHGLEAGRKVLIVDVQRNLGTGEVTLTLWG